MSNFLDKYDSGVEEFIDQVMRPCEYLSSIFINCDDQSFKRDCAKGELVEIGVVYATLNAYAKQRICDAFKRIENKTGEIKIVQRCNEIVSMETLDVEIDMQSIKNDK